MTERNSRSPDSLFFEFLCPSEKLREAKEVLRRNGGISLAPRPRKFNPNIRDPDLKKERREIKGFFLFGVYLGGDIKHLETALAKRGIAGDLPGTEINRDRGEIIWSKN